MDTGAGFGKTLGYLVESESQRWVSARLPAGLVTLSTGSLGVWTGVAAVEFV